MADTNNVPKSKRCCAKNKRNHLQCKNNTRKSPKCWIHLAWQDNLRIRPSNIRNAGLGLHTWTKPVRQNQKISEYTGRRVTKKALHRRYPGDILRTYALCSGNYCIDANYTTDGAPRYANDCYRSNLPCNAKFKPKKKARKIYLKSSRNINPHQEILVPYGYSYWT